MKIQRQGNRNPRAHPFPQHTDQKRVPAPDKLYLQRPMGREKDAAQRTIQRKLLQDLPHHPAIVLQL